MAKQSREMATQGSIRSECLMGIGHIERSTLQRILFTLTDERLRRKVRDINAYLQATHNNWNQTLIILLFRILGGTQNREAMERLANTISYTILARESTSKLNLDALLLGSAGLLELYHEDEYIAKLKSEFTHLATKYSIRPMAASEWQFNNIYPNNNPTLRLVQIAAMLNNNMITLASITACRSRRDVYRLFCGNISEYWINKISIESGYTNLSRRIGHFKCDILGINLVAPIMCAYRNYTSSEFLDNNVWQLLMDIPSEENIYTKLWHSYTPVATTALDSQALIQLSREYCNMGFCHRCPLAPHTLK